MRKGFTLIELLVVITIIGILMGLLLVSYQGTRKSARDGRRKADLEQIRGALEMCRSDTGSYPASLTFTGNCLSYLPSVPADPLASVYSYQFNRIDANTYVLCAYLEGETTITGTCPSANCNGNCGTVACNYKTCNP